jgi:hypothetical protein
MSVEAICNTVQDNEWMLEVAALPLAKAIENWPTERAYYIIAGALSTRGETDPSSIERLTTLGKIFEGVNWEIAAEMRSARSEHSERDIADALGIDDVHDLSSFRERHPGREPAK